MKRLVLIALLIVACASVLFAGQQYSAPMLDNRTPGNVPLSSSSLMYGYDGSSLYNIPNVDSNGAFLVRTQPALATTPTVTQIGVTSTATMIKAANTARKSLTVRNHAAGDIYLGISSGVTTTNGLLLRGYESFTIDRSSSAVYGIVSAGTLTVGVWEE